MAQYLVAIAKDDYHFIQQVDGKNIQQAIESLELKPGQKATVYRLAAPPRIVRVEEETVRKVYVGESPDAAD